MQKENNKKKKAQRPGSFTNLYLSVNTRRSWMILATG